MRRKKWYQSIVWLLGMILILCCFFAVAFGLTTLIYRVTGKPPELVAHILSGLVAVILLATGWNLSFIIFHKINRNDDKKRLPKMFSDTIEAINRIAVGDFNAFVTVNENDRHRELAYSINKLAKDLGSLEKLRQDFVSDVSHEIQSPLTSISGFAALLKNDALSMEQRNHYIDIIVTESKRLSKLSDNLLKLSTLEADNPSFLSQEFRLDKQLESIILMLEPQWSAKNLTLDLSLEKLKFLGDEELLTQVWINLLHNAIKFTPQDGCIEIVLKELDNSICCTIADNGIGISKEDQSHIFERFYKVDKSRDRSLGGNGLGLSLVKKIVEIHKGQIDIKSDIGMGTKFVITLPIAK